MPHELPNNLRLRTLKKLGNGKNPLKLGSHTGYQFLTIAFKNYTKAEIEVFWFCPILFDFLISSYIFCP